jgi:hypothetical protein
LAGAVKVDGTTETVFRLQTETIITRVRFLFIFGETGIMEVDLLLRFSLQPDNNKVTCGVWNRGESLPILGWTELRIWQCRRSKPVLLSRVLGRRDAQKVFMETSESSDWPLAPST